MTEWLKVFGFDDSFNPFVGYYRHKPIVPKENGNEIAPERMLFQEYRVRPIANVRTNRFVVFVIERDFVAFDVSANNVLASAVFTVPITDAAGA